MYTEAARWKLCHTDGYMKASLASSHASCHFNAQPFLSGRGLIKAASPAGRCVPALPARDTRILSAVVSWGSSPRRIPPSKILGGVL